MIDNQKKQLQVIRWVNTSQTLLQVGEKIIPISSILLIEFSETWVFEDTVDEEPNCFVFYFSIPIIDSTERIKLKNGLAAWAWVFDGDWAEELRKFFEVEF